MASNRREMSSSPGLSTPPKSPESPESPSSGEAIVVQSKAVAYPDLTKPPAHKSNTVKSARQSTAGTGESATKPPRRPRTTKKKQKEEEEEEEDGNAAPKQRKPRKKKDAQDLSASMASAQKPTAAGQGSGNKIQSSKQPRISELMSAAPPATPPNGPTAQSSVPIGNKSEAIQKSEFTTTASTNHTPQIHAPATAPASRGQNYDPIRSSTIELPRPMQVSNPATPAQTSPIKTASRASASPSIASLINPPSAQSYPAAKSVSRPSSSSAKLHISPHPNAFVHQPQKSAGSVESPRSVPLIPTPTVKPPTPDPEPLPTAMDIDSDVQTKPLKPATSRKPSESTNNSSNVPSPKQAGTKSKNSTSTPTLPPLPGTGTLSGSGLFNGGPSNEPAIGGQTIIIEVPLNGETNKCINFARLAEEKYGYNALYPKLAAQRDRLARIAAAGAALENATKANGTSADEMSLDVSEAEGDQSNADKKGSATEDGKPKKRKRTMKEDQYDKDDPFVDDSELAWEEQAAASKDGFFVYSGPLVAPGQQANVERADGSKPTTSKRGRGRGGGPGSRGGRGSRGGGAGRGRGGTAAAAAAATAAATAAPHAGTPGADGETHEAKKPRGGGTTRKPRITKADRARMEQEKLERERAGQGLTAGVDAAGAGTSGATSTISAVVLPKSPARPDLAPAATIRAA